MGQQLRELVIEPSLFNIQIFSMSKWNNLISDSRNITLKNI